MNNDLEWLDGMLEGEINRIFVTDDLEELNEMFVRAIVNLNKIRAIRRDELRKKEVI